MSEKKGRKFSVVIMVTILLFLGMVAGVIAAYNEFNLPWLAVTLPILAGVYPVYIAGNAYQHGKEINKNGGG